MLQEEVSQRLWIEEVTSRHRKRLIIKKKNPRCYSGRSSRSVSGLLETEVRQKAGPKVLLEFSEKLRAPRPFLLVVFLSCAVLTARSASSSLEKNLMVWPGSVQRRSGGERRRRQLLWQTVVPSTRVRQGGGRKPPPPDRCSFLLSTQVHLYKFHQEMVLPGSRPTSGDNQAVSQNTDGPRQKFWSISTRSIIPPRNGSCWTWSGMVQTTCGADHPKWGGGREAGREAMSGQCGAAGEQRVPPTQHHLQAPTP